MQSDPDGHFGCTFLTQLCIELSQSFGNAPHRLQSGTGRGFGILILEHGKQPVAEVFIDCPAACADCGNDGVKEPVEQEHNIIRKLPCGTRGEPPHIEKQNRQPRLAALRRMRPRPAPVGAESAKDRYIPSRAHLTGKARVGRGLDRLKRGFLLR